MRSTTIKIGNRTYSIASLCDNEFDQLLSCHGICDEDIKSFVNYDDQIIVVRERLSLEHKQELVLHELIHACLNDVGLRQSEEVEQFVSILTPRLSCLLSSNLMNVLDEILT